MSGTINLEAVGGKKWDTQSLGENPKQKKLVNWSIAIKLLG
jgi:hypothetical protein